MDDKDKEIYQLQRELNIRKTVIITIISIIIISIIVIFSLYIAEDSFRNWIDINIFRNDTGDKLDE